MKLRQRKSYPEECLMIPISKEPESCIKDSCYQWDPEKSKCKLLVMKNKK